MSFDNYWTMYLRQEKQKQKLCRKYIGDNDGTSPELGCIREKDHTGLCDNVSDAPDEPMTTDNDWSRP